MPSARSAEGKARQRDRNSIVNGTNAGSSGVTKRFLSKAHRLEWDEVEDEVEHVVDLIGSVNHSQVGAAGVTVSLTVPTEYVHDAVEAHLATRGAVAYIRIYVAPLDIFDDEDDDYEGDDDGDSSDE